MSPGRDSQMTLTWPSRDPAMTRVLLGHGFVPQTVLAVRKAGHLLPSGAADVVVREVKPRGVDAAVALWMEALRWDEQFGGTVIRASSEGRVREAVEEVFKPDGPWGWGAERDGQVAGLVVMQPPARAAWVAPAVAVAPASYLTCGIVTAGSRGGGVGGALVRRALEKVDAARLSGDLDQPPPPKAPRSVQDAYISTRRTRKAVSASARPSPESSRARALASSSQAAQTMRCLRCGRTGHPRAARCPARCTTSACDGNSTRTSRAGRPDDSDACRSRT
jgi:hypothetical protein